MRFHPFLPLIILAFGLSMQQAALADGVRDVLIIDSGQNVGDCRTFNLALGDLDADGDLDLAVNCWLEGLRVFLNNGSGFFSDSGQSLGGIENHGVDIGDLDGDGDADLFVVFNGLPDRVYFNDGTGEFVDSGQRLGVSDWGLAVQLGDLDGDDDLDALASVFQGANWIYWNDGNGLFGAPPQTVGGTLSRNMQACDVDGDGDLDIYMNNSHAFDRLLLNDGAGSFTDSGQELGFDSEFGEARLADLDGDGDLDVFVTNALHGCRVLLNDGAGNFSISGPDLGSGSAAVTLADLNGDTFPDAITAQSNGVDIWLNCGDSTFVASTNGPNEMDVFAIAVGDLDGNGDNDIVFGKAEGTGGNKVYLNFTSIVPVALASLGAKRHGRDVVLRWVVNDPLIDRVAFHVCREATEGARTRITDEPLSGRRWYEFIDRNAPFQETTYWLEELDETQTRRWHGPLRVDGTAPPGLRVAAAPNPFNPATTIIYTVPRADVVNLAVFDARGRHVETLVNDVRKEPGEYRIAYRPEKASGVYLVKLIVGDDIVTQKIVLLK